MAISDSIQERILNKSCVRSLDTSSYWPHSLLNTLTKPKSASNVFLHLTFYEELTIIGRGWAKYVSGEQINYLPKPKAEVNNWSAREIATRRKAWFHLRMSRILFAAKECWMAVRMSRPLFVGTYLQVTWWALGQWKGRKICNEW